MRKSFFLAAFVLMLAQVSSEGQVLIEAQIFNTKLRVTVIDDLGNVVEGAAVAIFATESDYINDEMPVAGPTLTNKKGRVTFKNLEEKSYYVDARFGDQSNEGSGVMTSKLEKGKINMVNTVIE